MAEMLSCLLVKWSEKLFTFSMFFLIAIKCLKIQVINRESLIHSVKNKNVAIYNQKILKFKKKKEEKSELG